MVIINTIVTYTRFQIWMTLAIVLTVALFLYLTYRSYREKDFRHMQKGAVLLALVVIVEKVCFSPLDSLDWMGIVLFAFLGVASVYFLVRRGSPGETEERSD